MISITYSNGRILQGIVLAFGDRLMRVAVKDSDDAVEYRLINQVWVSEDCEVVRLDMVDGDEPVRTDSRSVLETLFPTETHRTHLQRLM